VPEASPQPAYPPNPPPRYFEDPLPPPSMPVFVPPVATRPYYSGPSADAANYAMSALDPRSQRYATLSGMMCWDAALYCHVRGAGMRNPGLPLTGPQAERYFSPYDQRVDGPGDALAIPPGALIGFFAHRRRQDGSSGQTLIHAMISLGDGYAAGNKNDCIGVGNFIGWERLNLAHDLAWFGNGVRLGSQIITVRYRTP
jgi:hypothetical protein